MKDSPVNALFKKLIDFDKNQSQPVYIQIAQQIIEAIQRSYLVKGTTLPGTRSLSKLLKIHRNTAVAIYEELSSQGWVEIIPNKGTYVLEPKQGTSKKRVFYQQIKRGYKTAKTTGFPFQNSFNLASTKL